MLSEVSNIFGRPFLVGSSLPATFFLSLQWLLVTFYIPSNDFFDFLTKQSDGIKLSLTIGAVVVLGVILQLLGVVIVKVFQGSTRINEFPYNLWYKREKEKFTNYNSLIKTRFPGSIGRVVPTRLGNAIEAFGYYTFQLYQIDALAVWPRLIAVVPKEYLDIVDASKTGLEFFLNTSMLLFIGVIEMPLIMIFSSNGILAALFTLLILFKFLLPDVWWFFAAGVEILIVIGFSLNIELAFLADSCLIIVWLCYDGAVLKAEQWGEGIKSCFDLFRMDLLRKLGYKLPSSLEEERKLWPTLSKAYLYQEAPDIAYAASQNIAADPSSSESPAQDSENSLEGR